MARPRKKTSKRSYSNLGLKPEEDNRFQKLLKDADISARQLIRALIRQWVEEGGSGVLKKSTK